MVTTDTIKKLRDETGVSVMQCKKALEEAGGDVAKALVILKKKGAEASAKKADRTVPRNAPSIMRNSPNGFINGWMGDWENAGCAARKFRRWLRRR